MSKPKKDRNQHDKDRIQYKKKQQQRTLSIVGVVIAVILIAAMILSSLRF